MSIPSFFYLYLISLFAQETGRNSIAHNATVAANGLMHYGTTSDRFLRENLDWLKRASNWAKFTATGSLGVIHYVSYERVRGGKREERKWILISLFLLGWPRNVIVSISPQGHEKEALNLMSSYLPKDSSGSPYAEGGGLYALGQLSVLRDGCMCVGVVGILTEICYGCYDTRYTYMDVIGNVCVLITS